MAKEKPILFNTDMVRAILDGRKTQTRRTIKPKYKKDEGGFSVLTNKSTGERWVEKHDWDEGTFDNPRYVKPPYQVDDVLWVRETWAHEDAWYDDVPGLKWKNIHHNGKCTWVDYKATETEDEIERWRPPIHMPRWAARIFLRVTNVRVERLQYIIEEDARAEGCIDFHDKISDRKFDDVIEFDLTALWNSTIKKKDIDKYGWDANPWVWVIEFEVVTNV